MYTYMTKIISISDDAYSELKRMKDGMSFTEIILKLSRCQKEKDIMDYAGTLAKEDAKSMLNEISKERKRGSRRTDGMFR